MSLERIPIVERPVVPDQTLEELRDYLRDQYDMMPYADPSMYLLMVGEVHKARALEDPAEVTMGIFSAINAIQSDRPVQASVTGVQVFNRRGGRAGKHFVALELEADPLVARERKQLLTPFTKAGVDTRAEPFSSFKYSAVIAHKTGKLAISYYDLGQEIEGIRPTALDLQRPRPRL